MYDQNNDNKALTHAHTFNVYTELMRYVKKNPSPAKYVYLLVRGDAAALEIHTVHIAYRMNA